MKKFVGRYPTTWRFATILVLTFVALVISSWLDPVQNAQMAAGAAIAIAILGLTWLTGWSGQVSIGNSGFVTIGAYAAAIWATRHIDGSPVWISLVLAIIFGAIGGVIIGLPATRLKGPYLAGMTMAFAVVLPQFVTNLSSLSGGGGGLFITPLTPPTWFVDFFSLSAISANAQWTTDFIVLVAGISFFLMSNLFHSKTGRAMRLVRDNDVAAELVGINLPRTRTLAFVISAAYCGLAGGLLILVNQSVNPNSFPFTLSITILTLMVLGGIGTLSGAVIGGIIYAFSGILIDHLNSLTGIDPTSNLGVNMKGIIFGLVLILTMLMAPRGIVGLASRIRNIARR